MKTLILMRHAKSSWKDHTLNDFDRPLKKRGKKDAQAMGKILCEKELLPQKIVSSSAKRARRTAEILVEEVKTAIPIDLVDQLYMAEVTTIFDLIKKLPDELERVMLVGHNPGLESTVQLLSNEIESVPTGGVAVISLPIKSWKELSSETKGQLVELFKLKREKEK